MGNEANVAEVARLCEHELNFGNLEVFCNLAGERGVGELADLYPKIRFISDYNFSSYGSVIKYSPETHKKLESAIRE